MPKGRKDERLGRIPDLYPLQEHTAALHPARNDANVRDSDGKLIFICSETSCGTALTMKLTDLSILF
ncbi:MAG: YpsA SLOG family protein [Desulfonatronovibrio sp.]|nr:putative molybdenum carrier protein [Desulfovibrionales bacterium]